jgi:hypothetical protein
MEIRIYIGGHQATMQHFVDTLEANKNALAAAKTAFITPHDTTYPDIFKASKAIRKNGNPHFIQQEFLQKYTSTQDIEKLIFIDNRIIGSDHRLFEKELFYPKPGGFIKQIQALFENFPTRLYIETRDIANLLPANYYNRVFNNTPDSFEAFLTKINLEDLRWSSFIDRAQGRNDATIPITVWHYEDYPYIWRDIAGAITGVTKFQDFTGSPEKLDLDVNLNVALLFYKYTQKYPVKSQDEFDTLKKLFMERDLSASHIEDNPHWTPEIIQGLTHSYEDDWYYIERMEDVEVIQPRVFN